MSDPSQRFGQPKLPPELLIEFDKVRDCDDKIGAYSDHEGNDDGPTAYMWYQGKSAFRKHCQRAIDDHAKAVQIWEHLMRMNEEKR